MPQFITQLNFKANQDKFINMKKIIEIHSRSTNFNHKKYFKEKNYPNWCQKANICPLKHIKHSHRCYQKITMDLFKLMVMSRIPQKVMFKIPFNTVKFQWMIITDIETNKKLTWIEIGFWRTNTDYNISIK
jgi:hypothetical protein